MRLLNRLAPSWESGPNLNTGQEALKAIEVACALLDSGGRRIDYRGRALEWDLSKAKAVALEFEAPWFTERSIDVLFWCATPAVLEFTSPAIAPSGPIRIENGEGGIAARTVTLAVSSGHEPRSSAVRLSVTASEVADPGAKIYFGLGNPGDGHSTRMRVKLAANSSLALYAATWLNLFSLLFLVLSSSGVRGLGLAGTTLPLVPTLLDKLGIKWASGFDVRRLALFLRNWLSPGWARLWCWLSLPAAALVAYVIAALMVFAAFHQTLSDHFAKDDLRSGERAEFFCRYPERVEARTLLAKNLYFETGSHSLIAAYDEATAAVSPKRFLEECLSSWRLLPLFLENPRKQRVEATIFYSSLLWNPIADVKQFDSRMADIRRVLAVPASDPGAPLAALALAKYELKSIKNANEQLYCKNRSSQVCRQRQKECVAARARLEKLLNGNWASNDMQTVAYIEAHDAAASAYMSTGCSSESEEDVKATVGHYRALLAAMPRDYPRLDQHLTQLNLRKFADGYFEKRPGHPTSEAWKHECRELFPKGCSLVVEALINDGQQTLFLPDRVKRRDAWGRVSLPYLEGEELKKRLEAENARRWAWPL